MQRVASNLDSVHGVLRAAVDPKRGLRAEHVYLLDYRGYAVKW
jgi:hypothetical protein